MAIYLLKNENEIGPLTTEELQALLDAQCIGKDHPVRLGDGTKPTAGSIEGIRLAKRELPSRTTGQAQEVAVSPMGSLSRDIKGIKRNSAAVADELLQFMAEMRGKSPSEMLGAFAKSTLVRSGIAAAIILTAILLITTAIPFAMDSGSPPENTTAPAAITMGQTNTPPPPQVTRTAPAAPTNLTNGVIIQDPKPVADKLGIGETKEGTPSEPNPFETTDDLLKDLE